MEYYDVAYETCGTDSKLEKRLGYERIFSSKEAKVVDGNSYKGSEVEDSLFISSPRANIMAALKASPKAVVFPDSRIDRKVIKVVAEREVALCIPIGDLTSSYGLQRSRSLYMTSKLFDYARSKKIDVSFVTLARDRTQLCSYIQLIEMAKLLGASEEYARESISKINKSMVSR